MSDFSDFIAQLQDWSNRQDWTTGLVTSFVRMAEQKFNSELRIDRMLNTVQNTVMTGSAPLPDDWLEMDFVRIASDSPTGWTPIRYKPRDEFFTLPNTPSSSTYYANNQRSTYGFYTIEGRTLYLGGPVDAVDGTVFAMDYYAEVPVFSDTQDSWVYDKFPSLYLYAALMHADLHAVGEEQQAMNLKQLVEDQIQKLNMAHRYARASGSKLARGHVRSFG